MIYPQWTQQNFTFSGYMRLFCFMYNVKMMADNDINWDKANDVQQDLLEAVRVLNFEKIEELLQWGNCSVCPCLNQALMVKMMANTAKLKENNIDCDRSNNIKRQQDLFEAARAGDFERVQKLLESGVSADTEEFSKSLFYASKNCITPLQIAAANGHEKCVKILIDSGANVNVKNCFGVTALHMAAEKGHYFCIKSLLKAGANCCVPTKLVVPVKPSCFIPVPYVGGTTPLHLAAANNHTNCVIELIHHGADYNALDQYGQTSLYIAAEGGFNCCVLAHLKNAIGEKILSIPSLQTSDTPLHFAVVHTMVDCVRELLYIGSDVNHLNFHGKSPLHLAVTPSENENTNIKMEILKLLVLEGYNTDINYRDFHNFTPLHYACFNHYNLWRRRPEMATFLIAYGADISIKNVYGYSLLECELRSNEKISEILRYLVKNMLPLPCVETLRVGPHRNDYELPFRLRNINYEVQNDFSMADNNSDMEAFVPPEGNQDFGMNFLETTAPAFIPVQMRDHLYDHRMRQLAGHHARQQHEAEGNLAIESSYAMEKYLWYKEKASNPCTLMHNCRYVIRNIIGASRLKYIRRLPIPTLFQKYLLLETDE